MGTPVKIIGAATFDGRAPPYNNPNDVTVTAGSTLTLLGTINDTGTITLDGHLPPGGPALDSSILIGGSVFLQGGGRVTLRDGVDAAGNDYRGHNQITASGANALLRNVDNTIIGGGIIGNGGLGLVNMAGGVIVATQGPNAPATLAIATSTTVNAGLMEAINGATLSFVSSALNNSGTVAALGGSTVNIFLGVTGPGGTVEALGNGSTVFLEGGMSAGTLKGGTGAKIQLLAGTFTGHVTFTQGSQVQVLGAVIFDGRAPAFHTGADITASGDLTLKGTIVNTGSITLGPVLELGGNVTLQGGGTILGPGTITGGTLRNVDNLIEVTSGGMLNATAPVNNTGTIAALNGSTIDLFAGTTNNGGLIEALGAGASVLMLDANLTGGTLRSSGAGAKLIIDDGTVTGGVHIIAGTQLELKETVTFDGRAPAFNNTAVVTVDAGGTLTLKGTVVNTGSITLEAMISPTVGPEIGTLQIDGDVSLQGGGHVTLQSSSIVGAHPGSVLRNVDNIVSGSFFADADDNWALVNLADGIINATDFSIIDTGKHAITNAGLIEATAHELEINSAVNNTGTIAANGGTVILSGGLTGSTGAIEALGNSQLLATNVHLTGGVLRTSGSSSAIALQGEGVITGAVTIAQDSQIQVLGQQTLDGSHIAFHNAGVVTLYDGGVLVLKGSIVNTGLIEAAASFAFEPACQLQISGDVRLAGHGRVILDDAGDTGLFLSSSIDGVGLGAVLRNVDNTISGEGLIGAPSSTLTLVNQAQGTINANVTGHLLTIGAHVINAGLMEATVGGGMMLVGGTSGTGTIEALGNGSSVTVLNLEMTGGTLKTTGTGRIDLIGQGTLTGGVSLVQGTNLEILGIETFDGRAPAFHTGAAVTVDSTGSLTLKGTIVNTGLITEAAGSHLLIGGKVILQGHGKLNLQSSPGSPSFIQDAGSGAILENVDNTITAASVILGNVTLINDAGGVIITSTPAFAYSDSNGNFDVGIDIHTPGHTTINAGLMEATNQGEFRFDSALKNTGTVAATASSALVFTTDANVTNTGGLIEAIGANASVLIDSTISGGVLKSANGGHILLEQAAKLTGGLTIAQGSQVFATDGATFDGRTMALTNGGAVTADFLKLQGTIVNTGSITMDAGGHLFIDGAVTLQGHGKVTLQSNSALKMPSFIDGVGSNGSLENVDNTIAGTAVLTGDYTITNDANGVINSNAPTFLFPYPANNSFFIPVGIYINTGHVTNNAGLMEATAGSTLFIDNGVINTGKIVAGNGSAVILGGNVTSATGVLQSFGTGQIELLNAKVSQPLNVAAGTVIHVLSATMQGTIANNFLVATGSVGNAAIAPSLKLVGPIVNTATITFKGNLGLPAFLVIDGAVSLSGGGKILLEGQFSPVPVFGIPPIVQPGDFVDSANGALSKLDNIDNTISGFGLFGDSHMTLVNETKGVIAATRDSTNAPAVMDLNTGANTIVNHGLLEAALGGTLVVQSAVNNTGTILAANSSTVFLEGVINSTVGKIETTGTGTIELIRTSPTNVASSISGNLDANIHIGGYYTSGGALFGTVNNTGIITLAGVILVGMPAELDIKGDVRLQGHGQIVLVDNPSDDAALGGVQAFDNFISGTGPGAVLRNVDNTISGVGKIGSGLVSGDTLTLVNMAGGVIDATKAGTPIISLTIDTGGSVVLNAGLLEATGGGILYVKYGVNNTGTILAANGSTVILSGDVSSANGLLRTLGTGEIELLQANVTGPLDVAAGTTIHVLAATFHGAITSDLLVASGPFGTVAVLPGSLTLAGPVITNTATITLRGNSLLPSTLMIDGDVTLKGHGHVSLLDDPNSDAIIGNAIGFYNTIQGVSSGGAVLRNADNIISGVGTIGSGANLLTLVNMAGGVIDALPGAAVNPGLTIDTGANTVFNGGLMEATGGGQLKIRSAVNNAGGLIEALGTNSDVQVADVTGGVIQASGEDAEVEIAGVIKSATLKADGVGAEFALGDGCTLTGSVSIQQGVEIEVVGAGTFDGRAPAFHANMATVDVEGNSSLTLKGTIVNDGAITLNGVEIEPGGPQLPATMLIAGNVSLQGGGTVTLRDDIDNIGNDHQGFNFIEGSGSGAVLRNVDNTIAGGGEIGGGDLTLINQAGGVIDATFGAPGSSLIIDTSTHTVSNAGLMEATGGATLDIKSALSNTGTLEALAGSTVHAEGAVANAGNLIADGGSLIVGGVVSGSGHATIDNGGSLEFGAGVQEHVSFAGLGKLLLDASANFHGDIAGLASGDTIDFGDIGFGAGTTLNFVSNMANSAGVLHVADGTNHADLNLIGSYSTSSFGTGDDGGGHLLVSIAPPVVI